MIESDSNKLFAAAQALMQKLDTIAQSHEYNSIWTMAYIHGFVYKGENWHDELENLRKVLLEIKNETK